MVPTANVAGTGKAPPPWAKAPGCGRPNGGYIGSGAGVSAARATGVATAVVTAAAVVEFWNTVSSMVAANGTAERKSESKSSALEVAITETDFEYCF